MGLCGAQGSGKSTAAVRAAEDLADRGLSVAVLSLDDLYLPVDARIDLARTVHPLLRTRGVPGTHDVALGCAVLDALRSPGEVALPRFDKATDTRLPPGRWDRMPAPADVVLFEGWCVGARPQDDAALLVPINALERDEDADGTWRRFVNRALATEYRALFARIDRLAFLAAPDFATVGAWRAEQEDALRCALEASGAPGRAMDAAELTRFLAHYARLTLHLLKDMPGYAHLVLKLDHERQVIG